MAGTIIADTIQATSQQISLNVGNTTILTASSTGLTLIPTTNVNINVTNSTVAFGSGNVSRPSVSFTGNTSTGMYMPLANTVAWSIAGSEKLRLTSGGYLAVGTDAVNTTGQVRQLTVSNNGTPEFVLRDTSQAADSRNWRMFNTSNSLYLGTLNDAGTSGTDVMILDSSGRARIPGQPYLHATVAGGTTAINFGTTHANVTVPYNQIITNTGNHFNTSTNTFTCPVAGIYAVFATIQLGQAAGTSGVGPNMQVGRSGSSITGSYHFVQSSVGYQKMETTAFVKCAANDTLVITLYTGSAMTNGATEFNGDTRNALCIAFMG
jgi:hypothetical protein